MTRFLFISAPLSGHLDWGGYLQTAAELHSLGQEVLWISERPVLTAVARAGVPAEGVQATGWRWPPPPFPAGLTREQAARLRLERALYTWLDEEAVARGIEEILDVAGRFRPSNLVTEPFISAAALAAEKLAIPLVVCGWPAEPDRAAPEENTPAAQVAAEARRRVVRLCERFRVSGRNWSGGTVPFIRSPDLHITYFSPNWYAGEPAHLPQTRYAGGTRRSAEGRAAWLDELPADRPWVLVSLGSTFSGSLEFFIQAIRACVTVGAYAILSGISPDRAAELDERAGLDLSSHARIERWIDYDALFPHLSVILHHGGPGTVHRALCYARPQIVVPQAADQHLQALRLARSGAGLSLSAREATGEKLANALSVVLGHSSFAEQAQQFQAEMAALGGPAQAARWIMEIGKER